jgi:hypothetical protein
MPYIKVLHTMLRLLILLICLSSPVMAQSPFPSAPKLGQSSLYYFFWHIYDIELFINGEFSFEKPFHLTLTYQRDFEGYEIAKRSIDEIKQLGMTDPPTLKRWYSEMLRIFPDMVEGDTITGLYRPQGATHFYHNQVHIGTLLDPKFGRWFFRIWLDPKTPEPEMRLELLGAGT